MDAVLILHWVFAGSCTMLVAVATLTYGDDAFNLGYGSLFADEDAIVQCDACRKRSAHGLGPQSPTLCSNITSWGNPGGFFVQEGILASMKVEGSFPVAVDMDAGKASTSKDDFAPVLT